MKAICVDDLGNTGMYTYPLVVGNEYTITGDVPGYSDRYVFIAEHPVSKRGNPAAYNKECFAPLSDLDETTLVNEEFEEKYCVPVNKNVCG
jgi:hypothetical protein